MALTEREIKARLGRRNRHIKGVRVSPQLPEVTMTGTPARSHQLRFGLGDYWFVCYPNVTWRPTDADLKPVQDWVDKNPVTDGIELSPEKPKTPTKK